MNPSSCSVSHQARDPSKSIAYRAYARHTERNVGSLDKRRLLENIFSEIAPNSRIRGLVDINISKAEKQNWIHYNVFKQSVPISDRAYKSVFVDFIRSREWHWFITIPIGYCENEDQVLKRLRTIEAILCGKYLPNRYHRLPDEARFSMVVAFEGEVKLGTRHAHILVYIPTPSKKRIPQWMLSNFFPFEFRFLWNKLELSSAQTESEYRRARILDPWADIMITSADTARSVYTVKDVRQAGVSWSRFEFVTPPKFMKFKNENLSVIRNRDRQKRAVLFMAQA